MPTPIRVLVVDDSAFVRKVVTKMLARSPSIEVIATARDGAEALEMVARHQPDVVTLDLMMPRMNGVEFLHAQQARQPVRVVVCSISDQSGAMAIEALEAGALEFVQKPTALASDRIYELADELIAKVEAVARAGARQRRNVVVPSPPPVASSPVTVEGGHRPAPRTGTASDVVVLGISTGGPQALRELIPRLPASLPVPVVMVLHMPVGYTEMYASRLNEISALEVTEVAEGAELRQGVAWLAPAGRHLTFRRRSGSGVCAHLDLRPEGAQHRPSVDVLFHSAAEVFGPRVLGVVMTGMGHDGLLGAAAIKARGGRIISEAESSCVVYGMPRAVAEASLSDRVVTLDQMADAIMEML